MISLGRIEKILDQSTRLSELSTVRSVSKLILDPKIHRGGILVEGLDQPRRLKATSLSALPSGSEVTGLIVLPRDTFLEEGLKHYLQSAWATEWLENRAERRGEKWVLAENVLKMIPVPKEFLNFSSVNRPEGWDLCLSELLKTPTSQRVYPESAWAKFFALAECIRLTEQSKKRYIPLLTPRGKLDWSRSIGLLPAQECVSLPQAPGVRMEGSLPLNSPVTHIDSLKAPQVGILLMTESGSHLKLFFDQRLGCEIAYDQIKTHKHPTWSEIVQTVRIPRQMSIAETASFDILSSVERINERLQILSNEMEKLLQI